MVNAYGQVSFVVDYKSVTLNCDTPALQSLDLYYKTFTAIMEKESTINRALGGSTYPGLKLVRSSLCKKKLLL